MSIKSKKFLHHSIGYSNFLGIKYPFLGNIISREIKSFLPKIESLNIEYQLKFLCNHFLTTLLFQV